MTTIIIVFQKIVNAAVYEWDRTWKMPFNEAKCLAINFGKVTPVAPHVLPEPKTQNTLE